LKRTNRTFWNLKKSNSTCKCCASSREQQK